MKTNKFIYLSVLQGNYGYGWDDLCQYDHSEPGWEAELKSDRKAYRENEPYPHRVIYRRVLNPKYKER